MTTKEFIMKLTDLMDTNAQITLETKLSDLEDWDSLSMVSFFSFCNSTPGKKVSPEQIKSAQTVEELFKLTGGETA